MSVYLFIEGGGDTSAQQTKLRRAFSELLAQAGFRSPRMPSIILCGSRNQTFKQFRNSLPVRGNSALLLIDAEDTVTAPSCWLHLQQRDQWIKPHDLNDDQVHLMVELMESWFFCSPEKLQAYFGAGFSAAQIPGQASAVESITKRRVEDGLEAATRRSTRGVYNKGRHSADLLAGLDPAQLRQSAPRFESLIQAIRRRL